MDTNTKCNTPSSPMKKGLYASLRGCLQMPFPFFKRCRIINIFQSLKKQVLKGKSENCPRTSPGARSTPPKPAGNFPAIFLVGVLCLFFSINLGAAVNLDEVQQLLDNQKYSIALEKSLNILNTMESQLTPIEAGKLHYFIGLAYKKNNNKDMALDYFKRLEQQFPASAYIKNALMETAELHSEDYFQKEAVLEKVIDKFPKTKEAVKAGTELARNYIRLKNYQKAYPLLEKMINLWKVGDQDPELYMLIAVSYSGINDYIEAVDYLRKAEKLIPEKITTSQLYIFEAGKIFYNTQNFKKAIHYLGKMVNIFPNAKDGEEAVIILSDSYEREKNLFMSAIFLIKALEKKPKNRKKKYSLLLGLGKMLGRLKPADLGKIKKHYPAHSDPVKILTIVKKNSPIFGQKRDAAILLSNEFKKNNESEKVIDNYYNFLKSKRDPLVEKYFKEHLDTYIDDLDKSKHYDKIFEFWVKLKGRKSLLSGPNLLKMGQILYDMKLYKNSAEVYRHLRKFNLYSAYWPAAQKQLARLHFKLGDYNDYLKASAELKDLTPKEKEEFDYCDLMAQKNLGKEKEVNTRLDKLPSTKISGGFNFKQQELKADRLRDGKKISEALDLYKKLSDFPGISETDGSRLVLKIADLYYRWDDLPSSLQYYLRAEKLKLNLEWITFRKISILRKNKKDTEAAAALTEFKEKYPNSFWVKQLEKDVR
ncbi:MAG: tetratricopeptide repeat protein [bacterium]|nr:tetratricopeptide repeat protein [bacterium]